MLAFATDFVADAPLGTGIVEAPIGDELRALTGPLSTLARATQDWQVYDPARRLPWMTIPGVDWERDTVRWHTVEAPSGGLVPSGRPVYLFSGGCFFDFYAVGAIERDAQGSCDPRRRRGLLSSVPGRRRGLRPGPLLLAQRAGRRAVLDVPRPLRVAGDASSPWPACAGTARGVRGGAAVRPGRLQPKWTATCRAKAFPKAR